MASTLSTGKNLLPPQTPFVDPKSGVLSNDAYQYLTGLINQLANAIPTLSTTAAIQATGITQATATPLTEQWNEVTGGSGNGVLLAALQAGQQQTVFNRSGVDLWVYPPPGAQIEEAGANVKYVLANGATQNFDFITTTDIRTTN